MKKLFHILCFSITLHLAYFNSAYSQKIDSLETVLKLAKHDTTRLNILYKLIELCEVKDNLKYAQPVVVIAEQHLKGLAAKDSTYIFYSKHLAGAFNAIGYYYHSQRDTINAKYYYTQSINIQEKINDKKAMLLTLVNLGNLYNEIGDLTKAEKFYLFAFETSKNIFLKEKINLTSYLEILGRFYYDLGDYSEAEIYYKQSIEIRRNETGEINEDYASSLSDLGATYFGMRNFVQAEILYKESMEIIKKVKGETNSVYSASLNNLARLYHEKGDYVEAENFYLQALDIKKIVDGENSASYATTLHNLGLFYKKIGNYSKSEVLYLQSLEIKKKVLGETNSSYGDMLSDLANLYVTMGDDKKAEPLYLQSIKINPHSVAPKNGLAILYSHNGEYPKAEALHLQVLETIKKSEGEGSPDYAISLTNIALIYSDESDYSKAEPLLRQALEINKKEFGETNPDYIASLYRLASLYCNSHEYDKAEPLILKTFDLSFNNTIQQFSFLSEKEKEFYLKNISVSFDDLYYFSLARMDYNFTITQDAYNYLLKEKGLILKSGLAMRNAILSSNDAKLIANYDKWNSLKEQIVSIYNLPIEKRSTDLPNLESEANDLEKELTRSSPAISDFNSSLNINWKDIQKQLKPNEVAIEFTNFKYQNDTVLYGALIIKKDSQFPIMVSLFEEWQLTNILASLQEHNNYAITSVYGSKRFTETKLYDVIWKPLEPYLKGIETVNYSPSGLLHKIAFAALSNADDHYLIDDYKLNMLTSTALITKPAQSVFDKNTVVSLFGGINYSIKDTTNVPWNYLEGTLSETDQLNATFIKQGVKVNYIKSQTATKQEFKTVAVNSNIIHIATHGFFFPKPQPIKTEEDEKKENRDIASRSASRAVELNYIRSDNPLMRSGLVFAGVNDYWNGNTTDADSTGILTALDVVNIDLRKNKLIVLSACETALGDIRGGEGVYGLQRAFKMAGTENIIMSLWQVPDKETSEFMQTFYNLLFIKQNINQAFEETQKIMRKKYDPYYWAAFVLMR